MKQSIILIFSFSLLISCSNENNANLEAIKIESDQKENKITKNNIFEKIEELIEKKVQFEDVSITYEELLSKFSNSYRQKFIKDGGNSFKDLLPKWKKESEELLSKLCSENDITILDSRLTLDFKEQESSGYSCQIKISCDGENHLLKVTALEINNSFYILNIRDSNSDNKIE